MSNGQDPLQKFAGPLVAVLLALAASVFIAALIGGAMPLEYTGRALVYLGLLLYVIAGAVVVFRLTAQAEQAAAFSASTARSRGHRRRAPAPPAHARGTAGVTGAAAAGYQLSAMAARRWQPVRLQQSVPGAAAVFLLRVLARRQQQRGQGHRELRG